ncbi:10855_t:CDS:2 [Cetraspora pellucida]|uniref:10855_t:CDS:1 n=1 Tax=Cetraspora pellucida TaxID=1433469 RepID=A0ACA9KZL4_9GLOM|nr:10855_t:CDS:2 [Cetraspora pellucida]
MFTGSSVFSGRSVYELVDICKIAFQTLSASDRHFLYFIFLPLSGCSKQYGTHIG